MSKTNNILTVERVIEQGCCKVTPYAEHTFCLYCNKPWIQEVNYILCNGATVQIFTIKAQH